MKIIGYSSESFMEKVVSGLSRMGEQILEKTIESIKALGGSLKESAKHFDLLIMSMALVGPAAVGIVSAAFDINLTTNEVFAMGAAAGGATMILLEFQDRLRSQLFENKEEDISAILYKVGNKDIYSDKELSILKEEYPEDHKKVIDFYSEEKNIKSTNLLSNKAKVHIQKENGTYKKPKSKKRNNGFNM
jgi:hypothetical protein